MHDARLLSTGLRSPFDANCALMHNLSRLVVAERVRHHEAGRENVWSGLRPAGVIDHLMENPS